MLRRLFAVAFGLIAEALALGWFALKLLELAKHWDAISPNYSGERRK